MHRRLDDSKCKFGNLKHAPLGNSFLITFIKGCAGQSAKLTNPQTQGDLIVYRNDVKNIQKLPNQVRTFLHLPTYPDFLFHYYYKYYY